MKPYNQLTKEEKLACISLYPEEAKNDADWYIRREAYRILGFTEEAKKDKDWTIRHEAYRALGFTEEAKNDEYWITRQEAEIYFNVLNNQE